jgi:anti-anti-sigma factor
LHRALERRLLVLRSAPEENTMMPDYSMSIDPGEPRLGVLEFAGPLDSTRTQDLDAVLLAALRRHRIVVLDLTRVPYVSSAGWRAVLVAVQRVSDGERLHVAGMLPTVRETFEMLGFASVVASHATPAQAIVAGRRALAAADAVASGA